MSRTVYVVALVAAVLLLMWRFEFASVNYWIGTLVLFLGWAAGRADAQADAQKAAQP